MPLGKRTRSQEDAYTIGIANDRDRDVTVRGRLCNPTRRASDAQLGEAPTTPRVETPLPPVREVYEALVLGTRDYVTKNGFSEVLVGLSGGIDSSLVAVIAADALGPDQVVGILMPSR